MATREADADPAYVEALVRAQAADTVLTTVFSVMWPDAPHRVLRSCVEAAEALEGDIVGEMHVGAAQLPLPKFAVPCPTCDVTGTIAAMALYVGESVGAVTRLQSAGEVVRELSDEAERLLHVWT